MEDVDTVVPEECCVFFAGVATLRVLRMFDQKTIGQCSGHVRCFYFFEPFALEITIG